MLLTVWEQVNRMVMAIVMAIITAIIMVMVVRNRAFNNLIIFPEYT